MIARNKTGHLGPWTNGEEMSLDVDTLGQPFIDGSEPWSAGRLWVKAV